MDGVAPLITDIPGAIKFQPFSINDKISKLLLNENILAKECFRFLLHKFLNLAANS